jgi:GNAT superfamily N-acetyltransferase
VNAVTSVRPFRIRAGRPEDVDAVARLVAASAESQGAAGAVCVDRDILLADGFGANPRFRLLVAEADEALVGVALFFVIYSTWMSVNTLYLEDLYVDAAWRRRGVARALMQALAREARETGCRRVQWLVQRSNEAAIRFYTALGADNASDWALMQLTGERVLALARAADEAP